MSNVFIVDDHGPFIQYSGSWTGAGSGPEFNTTTSTPTSKDASATFNFTGTSISVFASVDIGDGQLQFQVDNASGTYSNPVTTGAHHVAIYQSPGLPDGPHTLVITAASDPPPRVFLDYLLYNSSSSGPGSILVDDNDVKINYTGQWTQFSSDNEMGSSAHTAGAVDASFSFSFDGTAIAFYGDLSNATNGLNLSVTIDNSVPQTVSIPNVTSSLPNNKIFTSNALNAGHHTLVVTAQNDRPFSLDYVLVTPNPGSSGNTSSPSASPTSAPKSSGSSSKSPAGAIAGGVIGGVAAIALLVFIWFWFQRRRRHPALGSGSNTPNRIQPFNDPPPSNSVTIENVTSSLPSEVTSPSIRPKQQMSQMSSIPESARVTELSSSPTTAPTSIPPAPSAGPPSLDSGLRFPRDSSGATVPPPGYTAD